MAYNLEEFLFASVPVLIIALILLLCGLWTRSKYNKKRNNATKATVTSIKVEEERTDDNFLKSTQYILTLSFIYNGSYVLRDFRNNFEYEVNSVIDIEVIDGMVNSILTEPAKDVMDSLRFVKMKGHKFLSGFGLFLLGFLFLGIITDIAVFFKISILECIVFEFLILIVYLLLDKFRNKMKAKYNLIASGGYARLIGKVIDKKKEVNYSKNRRTVSYYPIVLYDDGFDIKKKVLYVCRECQIGEDVIIYKNRETKEVVSEDEFILLGVFNKILDILVIVIVIVAFLGGISYV